MNLEFLQDVNQHASLVLCTSKLTVMTLSLLFPRLGLFFLAPLPQSLLPLLWTLLFHQQLFSLLPRSHFLPLNPTSPYSPLLSSLSCIQIDRPEFEVPLKQEQEQKIYAQVR